MCLFGKETPIWGGEKKVKTRTHHCPDNFASASWKMDCTRSAPLGITKKIENRQCAHWGNKEDGKARWPYKKEWTSDKPSKGFLLHTLGNKLFNRIWNPILDTWFVKSSLNNKQSRKWSSSWSKLVQETPAFYLMQMSEDVRNAQNRLYRAHIHEQTNNINSHVLVVKIQNTKLQWASTI